MDGHRENSIRGHLANSLGLKVKNNFTMELPIPGIGAFVIFRVDMKELVFSGF